MTKHRTPEERIENILESAAEEIASVGYAACARLGMSSRLTAAAVKEAGPEAAAGTGTSQT